MAMGSERTLEAKRGFFNDEFATMVQTSQLSKTFLRFWSEKYRNIALTNLFVRNIDVE